MHPSPAFKASDEAAMQIARDYPFAVISAWDGEQLHCVQAPLIFADQGAGGLFNFEGHLSLGNQFSRALIEKAGISAIAVFSGPNAYVSPSSYPSKAEHGNVVPTWNFLAAEARGTLEFVTDAEAKMAILARQTRHFESKRDAPWSLEDAEASYLDRLSRSIVGIRLETISFEATVKLSQNKTVEDVQGVVDELSHQTIFGAQEVASHMRALNTRVDG